MEKYLDREVKEFRVFDTKGDFKAYYGALGFVHAKGYDEGSMCSPMPIALVKGFYDKTDLPFKWKNFTEEQKKSVDGVIIVDSDTGDFRNGPVTVILFN